MVEMQFSDPFYGAIWQQLTSNTLHVLLLPFDSPNPLLRIHPKETNNRFQIDCIYEPNLSPENTKILILNKDVHRRIADGSKHSDIMEMFCNKDLVRLIMGWLDRKREHRYAVIKITGEKNIKQTRH